MSEVFWVKINWDRPLLGELDKMSNDIVFTSLSYNIVYYPMKTLTDESTIFYSIIIGPCTLGLRNSDVID